MESFSNFVVDYEYQKLRLKLICEGVTDATLESITPEKVHDTMIKRALSEGYQKGFRDFAARQVTKAISKKYYTPDHLGVLLCQQLKYPPVGPWMFITINCHENITIMGLIKAINNFTRKRDVLSWVYNFEQRSDNIDKMGNGLHCHMLMRNGYKYPCTFRVELEKSFNLVCDAANSSILNQLVCKPEHVKNRMKYISGNKKNADKCTKVAIDRKWRAIEGLRDFYEAENWEVVSRTVLSVVEQTEGSDSD